MKKEKILMNVYQIVDTLDCGDMEELKSRVFVSKEAALKWFKSYLKKGDFDWCDNYMRNEIINSLEVSGHYEYVEDDGSIDLKTTAVIY